MDFSVMPSPPALTPQQLFGERRDAFPKGAAGGKGADIGGDDRDGRAAVFGHAACTGAYGRSEILMVGAAAYLREFIQHSALMALYSNSMKFASPDIMKIT